MSKISDEIREFIDDEDLYPRYIAKLRRIADRADRELVELPRDKDGVPIHVGDAMCLEDGREAIVNSIYLLTGTQGITYLVNGRDLLKRDFSSFPICITHKQTDSLERIADELEEWSEDNRVNGSDEVFYRAGDLAERIRKLAKEDEQD